MAGAPTTMVLPETATEYAEPVGADSVRAYQFGALVPPRGRLGENVGLADARGGKRCCRCADHDGAARNGDGSAEPVPGDSAGASQLGELHADRRCCSMAGDRPGEARICNCCKPG